MNGTIELADALDEAARRIETDPDDEYDWGSMTACNCGVLAQVIAGTDMKGLHVILYGPSGSALDRWGGTWAEAGRELECQITGLPVGTILRTLGDAGLSFGDLADLEYLQSKAVIAEMGDTYKDREPNYANPIDVSRYMRAWARLIRRELPKSMDAADLIATTHSVREPALV